MCSMAAQAITRITAQLLHDHQAWALSLIEPSPGFTRHEAVYKLLVFISSRCWCRLTVIPTAGKLQDKKASTKDTWLTSTQALTLRWPRVKSVQHVWGRHKLAKQNHARRHKKINCCREQGDTALPLLRPWIPLIPHAERFSCWEGLTEHTSTWTSGIQTTQVQSWQGCTRPATQCTSMVVVLTCTDCWGGRQRQTGPVNGAAQPARTWASSKSSALPIFESPACTLLPPLWLLLLCPSPAFRCSHSLQARMPPTLLLPVHIPLQLFAVPVR